MARNFKVKGKGFCIQGETAGQGEALIFLHAGIADGRMWHPQLDYFAGSHQTVVYDRRGYGLTQSEDIAFSHLDDLLLVLEHLGINKLSIVGCSMGGALALSFARAYPERVNCLVLIAAAIPGETWPDQFPEAIQSKLDAIDKAEAADDLDLLNKLEADIWLDGPTSESGRVENKHRELFLAMNGIALKQPEFSQISEVESLYDRLGEIETPSLVVYGDLDFPRVIDNSEYLVGNLGDSSKSSYIPAESIVLHQVAHLLNLECDDVVNQHIDRFLKKQKD